MVVDTFYYFVLQHLPFEESNKFNNTNIFEFSCQIMKFIPPSNLMSDRAILIQLGVLIISKRLNIFKNDLLKIHDDDPQINRMDVVK
jgi:hypothetical protein